MGVLLFHYTHMYEELFGYANGAPFDFIYGYLGVQLFFIISGFVIFMTVERTATAFDFAFLRMTRLYPTYWAGVLTTVVGIWIAGSTLPPEYTRTPWEILVNLTMLHEFVEMPPVDGVYWTLARELIFYAIIFLVFALGLLGRAIPLGYAWLGVQLAANLIERQTGWFPWKLKFYLLTEYAHLFVAGIVFYQIWRRRADMAGYGLLVFALVIQFLLYANPDDPHALLPRWAEGLFVIAFFGIFLLVTTGRATFLTWRPLVFLGAISYALYLVHQVLGYAIIRQFDTRGLPPWTGMLAAATFSVAVATIITLYLERPMIRWLRGVFKPGRK